MNTYWLIISVLIVSSFCEGEVSQQMLLEQITKDPVLQSKLPNIIRFNFTHQNEIKGVSDFYLEYTPVLNNYKIIKYKCKFDIKGKKHKEFLSDCQIFDYKEPNYAQGMEQKELKAKYMEDLGEDYLYIKVDRDMYKLKDDDLMTKTLKKEIFQEKNAHAETHKNYLEYKHCTSEGEYYKCPMGFKFSEKHDKRIIHDVMIYNKNSNARYIKFLLNIVEDDSLQLIETSVSMLFSFKGGKATIVRVLIMVLLLIGLYTLKKVGRKANRKQKREKEEKLCEGEEMKEIEV